MPKTKVELTTIAPNISPTASSPCFCSAAELPKASSGIEVPTAIKISASRNSEIPSSLANSAPYRTVSSAPKIKPNSVC